MSRALVRLQMLGCWCGLFVGGWFIGWMWLDLVLTGRFFPADSPDVPYWLELGVLAFAGFGAYAALSSLRAGLRSQWSAEVAGATSAKVRSDEPPRDAVAGMVWARCPDCRRWFEVPDVAGDHAMAAGAYAMMARVMCHCVTEEYN